MIVDIRYTGKSHKSPEQYQHVRRFASAFSGEPNHYILWFYNRPEPVKIEVKDVAEIHITND